MCVCVCVFSRVRYRVFVGVVWCVGKGDAYDTNAIKHE